MEPSSWICLSSFPFHFSVVFLGDWNNQALFGGVLVSLYNEIWWIFLDVKSSKLDFVDWEKRTKGLRLSIISCSALQPPLINYHCYHFLFILSYAFPGQHSLTWGLRVLVWGGIRLRSVSKHCHWRQCEAHIGPWKPGFNRFVGPTLGDAWLEGNEWLSLNEGLAPWRATRCDHGRACPAVVALHVGPTCITILIFFHFPSTMNQNHSFQFQCMYIFF